MSPVLPSLLPEETHNFSSILKFSQRKNFHFYESGIFSQQTVLTGNSYLDLNSPHSPGLRFLPLSFCFFNFDHRLLRTGTVLLELLSASCGMKDRCPGQPTSNLGELNSQLNIDQAFLLAVSTALFLLYVFAHDFFFLIADYTSSSIPSLC